MLRSQQPPLMHPILAARHLEDHLSLAKRSSLACMTEAAAKEQNLWGTTPGNSLVEATTLPATMISWHANDVGASIALLCCVVTCCPKQGRVC